MIREIAGERRVRSSRLTRLSWLLVILGFLLALTTLGLVTEVGLYAVNTIEAVESGEQEWMNGYEQSLAHLAHFAVTGEDSEYDRFRETIGRVNQLGWARDELGRENPDYSGIESTFRASAVPTPRARELRFVLPWIKRLDYLSPGLDLWTESDSLIHTVDEYAAQLKAYLPASSDSSAAMVSGVLRGLSELDERVKFRSTQFDAAIAADQDHIERHGRLALLGVTILLFLGGGAVWVVVIFRLRRANSRIRDGMDFVIDLMDSASEAVFIYEADRRILYVNEHACTLTGYTKSELYAIDPKNVLTPESLAMRPVVGVELKPDEIIRLEREILRKDGATVPTLVSVRRLKSGHFLSIVRDITERKRIEEDLKIFRSLIDQAGDPVQVIDPETGRFLDGNQKSWTSLGYTRDEMIGMSVLDVDPTLPPSTFPVTRDQLGPNQSFAYYGVHRRKDGSEFPVEASARFVSLEKDYLVASVRDITTQKITERTLTLAKDEAEAASRLKSTILQNMSHELRTPLTGIIGFSQMLSEDIPESHREPVEMIELSANRLLDTLNSVLDLATIESGSARLDAEEFDLAEETRALADALDPIARRKGLELVVRTPAGGSPVKLDRKCWGRIVNNLVGNAIKFTESGRVEISVEALDDDVCMQVTDTGIGISENFLPRVFDAFQQESTGISRHYDGNGLGLAITRELVGLLGGSIDVQSRQGAGSTFTVCVPSELEYDPAGKLPENKRPIGQAI